jgi:hypothetical protein
MLAMEAELLNIDEGLLDKCSGDNEVLYTGRLSRRVVDG